MKRVTEFGLGSDEKAEENKPFVIDNGPWGNLELNRMMKGTTN